MNRDSTIRLYRFVEVLGPQDLTRSRRRAWSLVDGWLDLAEKTDPRSPKALLEGDYVVRLPDGSVFKEVSFKVEHGSVEPALHVWAPTAGRRWAMIDDDKFVVSDRTVHFVTELVFERVP